MDPLHDQPKMGIDVSKKTTQLNLWLVVALLVFVAAAAFMIFRVMRNPPDSTQEMQHGWLDRAHGEGAVRQAWV